MVIYEQERRFSARAADDVVKGLVDSCALVGMSDTSSYLPCPHFIVLTTFQASRYH
jgi:hypothetical protein